MSARFSIRLCTLSSIVLVGLATGCSKRSTGETFTNCKLPIADGDIGASVGGFPRNSNRIASTGTVNATVILVDFSDAVATMTPAAAFAKISGATATFTEMSYGKMQFTMTPKLQWLRMSKASTQYALKDQTGLQEYIQEAVNLADSTVDFSTTSTVIVLTNPDASGIGTIGPAFLRSAGHGVTTQDGKEILNGAASAYDLNTWGSIWLNHETGHTLGLVDLYSSEANSFEDSLKYVGGFSYMGYNSFESNAPGLTAWERWLLGWLDDSQVSCKTPKSDGEISALITPVGTTGGLKAVVVPIGSTKVLVVESRRASGIDAKIAKTGALVYTVDSSVRSGSGPINVYPRGSDTLFTNSPLSAGESVSVQGVEVEVVSSASDGDTVRISTSSKLWVEK